MTYPRELTNQEKNELLPQTSNPPDWTGVYLLSEFRLDEQDEFNCMGWALNDHDIVRISNKADSVLYLLNKEAEEDDTEYELITDDDYSDAKFMLFGEGTDVGHITIKLTYDEIKARSKDFNFIKKVDFNQLKENEVPDSFWCCAIGGGYGVITHPQNWFVSEAHPDIVGGIKVKS